MRGRLAAARSAGLAVCGVVLAACGAVLAACAVLLAACGGASDAPPTYEVVSRPFVHRVTAEGVLEAAQATALAVPAGVDRTVRLAWLAPEGSRVEAGQVVARFDPQPIEEQLAEGRAEHARSSFERRKAEVEGEAAVAALDTDLALADLELDVAQRFQKTDANVFSRHEIIESQIDENLAQARKEHAAGSRQVQAALGGTEIDLVAIKQRQAQLKIDQATQGLAALEVRAPHAGILSLARDWNGEPMQVGRELWEGQELAEIPSLDSLEAEVFVLEADAGGIAEGKPAEVVVEAHPETAYAARIQRADRVARPRFPASPVQYFGVILGFDDELPAGLKPGQRVQATLLLEEIDEALVVPRQAVVPAAGGHWVYLWHGDGFRPRAVEIGASSVGLVVVTGGLEAGDVIALRPPAGIELGSEVTEATGAAPAAGG